MLGWTIDICLIHSVFDKACEIVICFRWKIRSIEIFVRNWILFIPIDLLNFYSDVNNVDNKYFDIYKNNDFAYFISKFFDLPTTKEFQSISIFDKIFQTFLWIHLNDNNQLRLIWWLIKLYSIQKKSINFFCRIKNTDFLSVYIIIRSSFYLAFMQISMHIQYNIVCTCWTCCSENEFFTNGYDLAVVFLGIVVYLSSSSPSPSHDTLDAWTYSH